MCSGQLPAARFPRVSGFEFLSALKWNTRVPGRGERKPLCRSPDLKECPAEWFSEYPLKREVKIETEISNSALKYLHWKNGG